MTTRRTNPSSVPPSSWHERLLPVSLTKYSCALVRPWRRDVRAADPSVPHGRDGIGHGRNSVSWVTMTVAVENSSVTRRSSRTIDPLRS